MDGDELAAMAVAPGAAPEAPPGPPAGTTGPAIDRDEVLRRTRSEFVVARPSELHPELDVPGLPPHPIRRVALPRHRLMARIAGVVLTGRGLLVMILAAVALATLLAYWLSPTA